MPRKRMVSPEALEAVALCVERGEYGKLPNPMKTEEAAAVARRSPSCVREACASGELQAVRFRGTWNINRESVLHYAGLVI
jgi:hypothetical protein